MKISKNGKPVTEIDTEDREAEPVEAHRVEPDDEPIEVSQAEPTDEPIEVSQVEPESDSSVDQLGSRFMHDVAELARALRERAATEADQEAAQIVAKAEAQGEEIVKAAIRRADDLDARMEATAREMADRITDEFTSAVASIKDLVSQSADSDGPMAPQGNPPWR